MQQTIRIHSLAPHKPALGAACNGCGVCCAAEPCPIGRLVSRRLHGACAALAWDDAERRYRCGLLGPGQSGLRARLVRRLIAAGRGCDSDAEVLA